MRWFKTQFVRQRSKSDCGVACLEMIFKYYGLHIPYYQIKKYTDTKSCGTSMMGLSTASMHFGFRASALKTEIKEDILLIDKYPFIAHMHNKQLGYHYVVVYNVRCEEVVVGDPEEGMKKISISDFCRNWTGKLLLLHKEMNMEKKLESESSLSRLASIFIPEKKMICKILVFSLIGVMLSLLSTGYFAIIIDYIIPNNQINTLNLITLAVVVLYISRAIIDLLKTRFTNFLAQKLCVQLMLKFFNHLVKLPMRFFSEYSSGEIIARFNDAELICTTLSVVIISAILDLIMVLLSASVIFFISHKLLLISSVPICLYIAIMMIFKKKLENTNKKVKELNASLTSFLNESLHGVDFIKIFHSEENIKNEMKKRFIESSDNLICKTNTTSLQELCKTIVYWLFITVIIWFGANEILNNRLTVGELVATYTILGYFLEPLQRIASLQDSIQSTLIASERLFEIIDVMPEANDYMDEEHNLKGDIKFENVTFRYNDQVSILKEFNLEIPYGEKVAIVGKSGVGKTTIARLLLKFYALEAGTICINGNDIRKISIDELRTKIAYIPQNVFFFSGSIMDNFKLMNKNVTQEEVEESCKKVKIHDYIQSLPYQYNTLLTENANNLSGGQRQLLSIARALVKCPSILILDEITSNLDSSSVDVMKELVYHTLNNMTIIIISHDIEFLRNCTQINILENGEIVKQGKYNEVF